MIIETLRKHMLAPEQVARMDDNDVLARNVAFIAALGSVMECMPEAQVMIKGLARMYLGEQHDSLMNTERQVEQFLREVEQEEKESGTVRE